MVVGPAGAGVGTAWDIVAAGSTASVLTAAERLVGDGLADGMGVSVAVEMAPAAPAAPAAPSTRSAITSAAPISAFTSYPSASSQAFTGG